ncbi:hypothetical protein CHUAL_007570 [Chamberlinius hualienensis]
MCRISSQIKSRQNGRQTAVEGNLQDSFSMLSMLLANTLLSGPIFRAWSIRPMSIDVPWSYYFKIILPLAFGKFISSVSSHVSIWKVPVSYAHTVKGTMPLFTVLLSRLILGEKQTLKVYVSLCPIICGIIIASVTEISFNQLGLISALFSTVGFSLMNIFTKKVLKDTNVHHLRLLHLLAKLALVLFFPFWAYFDMQRLTEDINSTETRSIILLVLACLFNFSQNVVAFSILNVVTPLTYSENPVTLTNVCGMMLAIIGVFMYNKAKFEQNRAKKALLPVTIKNVDQIIRNGDLSNTRNTSLPLLNQ